LTPHADELTPVYELRSVEVALGGRPVLGPLDLKLASGSFVAIVGPNGSGKTTLLRTLTGAVRPTAGEVLLQGRPLAAYHSLEVARLVGVVPQSFNLDFSFTVAEMVAMGRYPHGPRETRAERAAARAGQDSDPVAAALQITGLTDLADRPVTQLSGGERQRAVIAQTLAQDTPTVLLDEPLNNLDLNHQLETMQLLRSLHSSGRTVVVVLHDLNMAAQYCDELLLIDQGRIAARGTPAEVLDPRLILEIFKARVSVHRQGRRPYVTPIWSEPLTGPADRGQRRVHVIAGGGAASPLIEEMVMRGFAPSVGVVSVFDTDYATAQAYGLEVVSAPPFEPFTAEAMREFDALAEQADTLVVAPVFFGRGNLAPLHTALRMAKAGGKVIVIDQPTMAERDMSAGEATALVAQLLAAGALKVENPVQAVEMVGSTTP
jgi:iron complex transport system ATP-binding protein